jgi:hypothetical protein
VCCKSQDISCGMRKIENWSDHFGTQIALRAGISESGLFRVTRELPVWNCQNSLEHWQPLSFEGLSCSNGNSEKVHGRGREN